MAVLLQVRRDNFEMGFRKFCEDSRVAYVWLSNLGIEGSNKTGAIFEMFSDI